MLSTNLKKAVLSHTAFITIHLKEAEEGVYALLLFLKIQQTLNLKKQNSYAQCGVMKVMSCRISDVYILSHRCNIIVTGFFKTCKNFLNSC